MIKTEDKMIKLDSFGDIKLAPFVDDRIRCSDCQHHVSKSWNGKCKADAPYFNDLPHRCYAYQAKVKQTNVWTAGQKPFWE
jgi:hypothetical protein